MLARTELKRIANLADVLEVSQITSAVNATGDSVGPQVRRRPVSSGARHHLTEALGAEAGAPTDTDAPGERLADPPAFTPDSVVDITWPAQMTYDVDGTPSGMTAPRIYRLTAGQNGTLARWLTLQEKSA